MKRRQFLSIAATSIMMPSISFAKNDNENIIRKLFKEGEQLLGLSTKNKADSKNFQNTKSR